MSCIKISSTSEKESLTVNSFYVISDKMGTKKFTNLEAMVPITKRIGLNAGNSVERSLCMLANSESVFGFKPTVLNLL